ncbi:MAG TPA: hypothetical protein VKB57_09530, partial [Acidimicrobiales bacterium]|nr:hypothetical protein [Acidimicrobiales bacterium]
RRGRRGRGGVPVGRVPQVAHAGGGHHRPAAIGAPVPTCADTPRGCRVSFTLGWADGYVENPAAVLTVPGRTTG